MTTRERFGDLELRHAEDGLDEIVGHAHVHLERMDDDHVWLGLTLPDGRTLHVDFTTRNDRRSRGQKIYYRAEER